MKKRVISLLILLLLAGCGKKKPCCSAAVLERAGQDDGIIVLLSGDGGVLYDMRIGYPYDVYFGPSAVYYTIDGSNYSSLDYQDHKKADELSDVAGTILYHVKGGLTAVYKDGTFIISDADQTVLSQEISSIEDYILLGNILYFWNESYVLYGFDMGNGRKVLEASYNSNGFTSVTEVNGQAFLVTEDGYTEIGEGKLETTYVYPRLFEDVIGTYNEYLEVNENQETAVYKVEIGNHRMNLTPEYDDIFLEDVNFEKMYAEYYEQGYEVMAYWEVE